MIGLTIEEKEKRIDDLKAEIKRIKALPVQPYELVMITFDGHGLQSAKRTVQL